MNIYKKRGYRKKSFSNSESSTLTNLGNLIAHELTSRGVIVHYYKSLTSNSLYYKFDYGLAYSLRISDHPSKDYLHYRFNALTIIDKKSTIIVNENFHQTFFPIKKGVAHKIVDEVLKQREHRIKKYGTSNYRKYMRVNKERALYEDSLGFWAGAKRYIPNRL